MSKGFERFKDDILLKKLEVLDSKYKNAIQKPSNVNYGYAMRAYHALKVANPPEWKYREKANIIKDILTKRNVKFNTYFV
jgi:hypothetical protein